MIKSTTPEFLQKFIDYLNEKFPTPDVGFAFMPQTPALQDPNGTLCFGVYIIGPNPPVILTAGDTSEIEDLETEEDCQRYCMETLAHEYCHHIQTSRGDKRNSEREAQKFQRFVVEEYLNAAKGLVK